MKAVKTLAPQYQKINEDIQAHYPFLTPITPEMKTTFKGVSRMVMLDRYSYKDTERLTLTEGDLVVVTYKEDPKFPARGFGYIQTLDWEQNKAVVQLDEQFEGGMEITLSIDKLDKPLELFYEQIANRVAKGLSEVESPEKQQEICQLFYEIISDLSFVPAGRVLMGAGSGQGVTYFNCYVMPFIQDSRGGIADHRKLVMEIMSRGGGVGTNGSTLRPRDSLAKGVNGRSSGAVTWLNDLSQLTNTVEQGGSRRGAQMIMLNVWHPDIVEFIISKMQNPDVLRYIINITKSDLIREEAKRKLKFTPLTETERETYEYIVRSLEQLKETFGYQGTSLSEKQMKILQEAKQKLQDGGTYSVHNPNYLEGANISVCITKEFMEAVEKNTTFKLCFPDIDNYTQELRTIYNERWHQIGDVREWEQLGYPVRTYHTIDANELWNLINICATYSAEPGIFFIDNANEMTNAVAYGYKVVATNPCGEQPLAPFSVCNLGAVNLATMAKDGQVDWQKLKRTVQIGVRMQDNVIDATPYFLKENEFQAKGERRVGLGVMGLHDLLIKCGVKYGSEEGNKLIDEIFEHIAVTAYETSIELAKEKGSFPFLEIRPDGTPNVDGREKFIHSGYMKKMPECIRQGILEYGIRNSHLLTIAPTGSTGTMMNVSTGLEPYFSFMYYRSGRLGQYIPVISDIAIEWLEENGYDVENGNVEELLTHLPDHFVSAMELPPEAHADVQCIIQRWVDSSISKTVNAPKGYTVNQVKKVYESLYKGGAKGGTVYVDGSRDAQVLTLTKEEYTEKITTFQNLADDIVSESTERKVGNDIGDICPVCQTGTIRDFGGCHTCDSCKAQVSCGL